jgi:AcrR family transcriptional regulator
MARPRSDDRKIAILEAATRIIAAQGLGAPTAAIAKEADISNGSLFTYFATKADLLNELYVTLKTEMGTSALEDIPVKGNIRTRLRHVWMRWLLWAVANPEKRRTLAHLGVSDDITPESHRIGSLAMAPLAKFVEEGRAKGPMRNAPLGLVIAVMNGVAESTIAFMSREPKQAETHAATAFEAIWRMVA